MKSAQSLRRARHLNRRILEKEEPPAPVPPCLLGLQRAGAGDLPVQFIGCIIKSYTWS